ncbi:hypothetical protein B566_EDAN014145 [Ephemera danica]|nr:hypothetical protein B566_EDAN014145 [Ephemera danica]
MARRSGISQLDTRVQNNPTSNMKVFMVLAAVACVASAGVIHTPYAATTLVRAPAFDSAVIKSDRLGGNFAYSTAENHAYAAVSPVVQHVATPVAVSYSAPAYYHAPTFAYAGYPGYAGYAAAPAVVAAHAPVVAHAPFAPLPFVVPGVTAAAAADPAPAPVEDAAPAAAEAAPAEPAPAAPASDDSVSVEAA